MSYQKNIYVSDDAEFEDDFACKNCKDYITNPYLMTEKQLEPTEEYRCTFCNALMYSPK